MDLQDSVGTQVTLRGTADDDAAGAVIAVEDSGKRVFIAGLSHWDKAVRGKPVEVTGKLDRRAIGPAPKVTSTGLVTHGMTGQRFILDGATWKLGA
jgi:hypothetical protein